MIKYVVLLRGINISGKNKISMSKLKNKLEKLNYSNVITYLNSGNIIFDSDEINKSVIENDINTMIKNEFKLDIPIYITTISELEELCNNAPLWWQNNDKNSYNNIIFLIPPITYNEVYDKLGDPNNEFEKIFKYENSIFWSYDLNNYRKTYWWSKTASVDIRNSITIRTSNTIKKIIEISKEKEVK